MLLTFTIRNDILIEKGRERMKTISRCEAVKQTIYLDEKEKTTYGILVEWEDGTVLEKCDIAPDKKAVQRLATQLLCERADEEQLCYIIEDFLAKQYTF